MACTWGAEDWPIARLLPRNAVASDANNAILMGNPLFSPIQFDSGRKAVLPDENVQRATDYGP